MPAFDYTVDFANWWSRTFPAVQCPVLPNSPEQLSLSARMALEQDNPILFQNLFGALGSTNLPADTVARRNSGQLLAQDIPHLRAAGLAGEAEQLQQQTQLQQDQRAADDLVLMQKRNRHNDMAVQTRIAETSHDRWARMLSNPPSPESIAAAKAAWGITRE